MANNTVTVRSISQLATIQNPSDITERSLFEISKYDDKSMSYTSKGLRYETLQNRIQSEETERLSNDYGLRKGVNVDKIEKDLSNLLSNDVDKEMVGNFIFHNRPYLGTKDYGNGLATLGELSAQIGTQYSSYIKPDSNIVDLGTLTAAYKNSESINPKTCTQDGHLMLYGWVIDTGNVSPAQAYVSLQAKIKGEWEDIQHSPWIIGSNHKYLQYVSFNITVKKGLEVRIVSGFELGQESSYNQNKMNTLTNQEINIFKAKIIY